MAQQQYPLVISASVILDSSGNGTASCGPGLPRQHWQPVSCAVSATSNVNEATCALYLGSTPIAGSLQGQTSTGSSGDTCALSGVDMQPGQQLWCVWKGGDAGAQATMAVLGTVTQGAP